jgi:hypothetical protein
LSFVTDYSADNPADAFGNASRSRRRGIAHNRYAVYPASILIIRDQACPHRRLASARESERNGAARVGNRARTRNGTPRVQLHRCTRGS